MKPTTRFMGRFFLLASSVFGFLAVALGAFGAHGLRNRWAALPDSQKRLEWWSTATTYQMFHVVALGMVAWLCFRQETLALKIAGFAFMAGITLFSGSLYTMALTGVRVLGAVTPLGGLAFLAAWASLFVSAWKMSAS
jgi:uncharacterized membrane protein YgdD (TMEM256/DUF423 family)